jgi:hypothetical protein
MSPRKLVQKRRAIVGCQIDDAAAPFQGELPPGGIDPLQIGLLLGTGRLYGTKRGSPILCV